MRIYYLVRWKERSPTKKTLGWSSSPNSEAGWEEAQAVHWAGAEGAGCWSALRKKMNLFKHKMKKNLIR